MQISLADAQARYGIIQNGVWADEAKWCFSYVIPAGISLINCDGGIQKHIYCNKDMVFALDRAFKNVLTRGLSGQLKTFDGCLMVRDVRGEPGKVSAHAYALAIDLNAATNGLGKKPMMSPELVACFTEVGFAWGGNFSRLDGMHYSFCWE